MRVGRSPTNETGMAREGSVRPSRSVDDARQFHEAGREIIELITATRWARLSAGMSMSSKPNAR